MFDEYSLDNSVIDLSIKIIVFNIDLFIISQLHIHTRLAVLRFARSVTYSTSCFSSETTNLEAINYEGIAE